MSRSGLTQLSAHRPRGAWFKPERITVLWYSKLYGTARCTAVRERGNTPLTLSPYYTKKKGKKILNFLGNPA